MSRASLYFTRFMAVLTGMAFVACMAVLVRPPVRAQRTITVDVLEERTKSLADRVTVLESREHDRDIADLVRAKELAEMSWQMRVLLLAAMGSLSKIGYDVRGILKSRPKPAE